MSYTNTNMSDGERAVWAAVYGSVFARKVLDQRPTSPRQEERMVARAAEIATNAVYRLRLMRAPEHRLQQLHERFAREMVEE